MATLPKAGQAFIKDLRAALRDARDPDKAIGMQRYMKSEMPYWGVQSKPLKDICRRLLKEHPMASEAAWEQTVRGLWRTAEKREERYAALHLAAYRDYRAYQTPDRLPLYEELIVTGAWWDYVDDVAIHKVGPILKKYPKELGKVMRAWSTDADLWKRRSSIICQIGLKERTDYTLLFGNIEKNLADKDFFIRKAIGWALRQVAWHDPKTIEEWVEANRDRLSPLSYREAMKNIVSGAVAERTAKKK